VDNEFELLKVEDVTEIDAGGHRLTVVTLTDENRPAMVRLALSMYLGEKCKYCLRQYTTLEDLENTVWAGYHEHGRLACQSCWRENNPQ
jgi:hypothetical protein